VLAESSSSVDEGMVAGGCAYDANRVCLRGLLRLLDDVEVEVEVDVRVGVGDEVPAARR
jgi:hypothetical protein